MSTETISVTVFGESDKALHLRYLGKDVWLPKSQIERMERKQDKATITIPFWLYEKHWD